MSRLIFPQFRPKEIFFFVVFSLDIPTDIHYIDYGVEQGRVETMTVAEMQTEALGRARGGQSVANYLPIFNGFLAMGIAEDDIRPRENIFTYRAWQALGRQVRKGEHGVKVHTWIPTVKTDAKTGDKSDSKVCRTTTVFHVSQTDEIGGK